MLGREGENKNCLLGWVWVHKPERLQPKLVVAAGSLQPAQTPMGAQLGFIYMGFSPTYGALVGVGSHRPQRRR
jgi:hypothetical protein